VNDYTRPPDSTSQSQHTSEIDLAEEEYVWSRYLWESLGSSLQTARNELLQLNTIASLDANLLSKKEYFLNVVKTYESMAKKHTRVSCPYLLAILRHGCYLSPSL
jgi:hypothetical protein